MSDHKEVVWVASAKKDLKKFPKPARRDIGHALDEVENGGTPPNAKPLTGRPAFRGSRVMELVVDYYGDTYRGVYTAQYAGFVFVLHCFNKKSKHGIATPQQQVELIEQRLAEAKEIFETIQKMTSQNPGALARGEKSDKGSKPKGLKPKR